MFLLTDKQYKYVSVILIGFLVLLFGLRNYIFSVFFTYPFGFGTFAHIYNTLVVKNSLIDFVSSGGDFGKLFLALFS